MSAAIATRRCAGAALALFMLATATATTTAGQVETPVQGALSTVYEVLVRRDGVGVAHIEAADYGSLGYGEGYAAAEDHLCNIAYELMRARGEMARYLGPGEAGEHVVNDAVLISTGRRVTRSLASRGASASSFRVTAPASTAFWMSTTAVRHASGAPARRG